MAAKKAKRPPRQVWINLSEIDGYPTVVTLSKKDAEGFANQDERTVGPYVLAERVREK